MVQKMSFQAYLDTIKEKTGKGPDDFVTLARAKGFDAPGTKAGDIVAWLDQDFGLGRGHAMAIVNVLKAAAKGGRTPNSERIDKLFSGGKSAWREDFDALLAKVQKFGDDVGTAPTDSYVSFTRNGKKFAIVAPTAAHMDIGIKRKGVATTERFAEAGAWNAMVTHRVRVTSGKDIDKDVMAWLKAAYQAA
jgi:Domain of unknown function (DUF4287)/Domain of unknown function (DUF5655)